LASDWCAVGRPGGLLCPVVLLRLRELSRRRAPARTSTSAGATSNGCGREQAASASSSRPVKEPTGGADAPTA